MSLDELIENLPALEELARAIANSASHENCEIVKAEYDQWRSTNGHKSSLIAASAHGTMVTGLIVTFIIEGINPDQVIKNKHILAYGIIGDLRKRIVEIILAEVYGIHEPSHYDPAVIKHKIFTDKQKTAYAKMIKELGTIVPKV